MNEFWKWMKGKEYSTLEGPAEDVVDCFGHSIIPTVQMLIGYLIEYIKAHEFWYKKENEEEYEFQLRITKLKDYFKNCVLAENAYFALRDILEKLKK